MSNQSKSLIVIDNFLTENEFQLVLQDAMSGTYSGVKIHGEVYGGISPCKVPFNWDKLPVDATASRLEMYRCAVDEEDLVTWIHADNGMNMSYAFVFYIHRNDNGVTGTAFWKHKHLGINHLSNKWINELKNDSILEEMLECLDQDGQESDMWTMEDYVSFVPNRLIIYPTNRFHSRFPKSGFGDGPWNGRLIQVGFFNIQETV